MDKTQVLRSIDIFARNVTDCEELGQLLINAARAELGPDVPEEQVERRAEKLLFQSLDSVGIDPISERFKRQLLFPLLRGDPLSDVQVQKAVEYILFQMVIQPKGALAECLALPVGHGHLQLMKESRRLPPNSKFMRSAWSRRLVGCGDQGMPVFGEDWREAADGLFYGSPTPGMKIVRDENPLDQRQPGEEDLLVYGAAEVKCFSRISRRKLSAQLDTHIARLAGGLQLRDVTGRIVEREYPPERLWYAVWNGDTLHALPVTELPFRVSQESTSKGPQMKVQWTSLLMSSLVRLTIGPRKSSGSGRRPTRSVFDAELPFDQSQLEEIGTAMAYYTLGAMADQPEVDLPGPEWSWNLERALDAISPEQLTKWEHTRRDKILRRLR